MTCPDCGAPLQRSQMYEDAEGYASLYCPTCNCWWEKRPAAEAECAGRVWLNGRPAPIFTRPNGRGYYVDYPKEAKE